MEKVPLLLFVGGFLGAGKTTALSALAKVLKQRGFEVAAITNDQADGLVDTAFLDANGLPAREVAGSCFCCNFNGLADTIIASIESEHPDVILAEPVGSCTDIVATVIRPMRAILGNRVKVGAFSVLVEPKRWQELGDDDASAPWSMKYLFERQLEEADCILTTKVDTLNNVELQTMVEQIALRYPAPTILQISCRENRGLTEWFDFVSATPPQQRWLKDIDYTKYAEAEAEMGWLNARIVVENLNATDGAEVAGRFLELLTKGVEQRKGRIGNLKILATSDNGFVKAGITRVGGSLDVDGSFSGPVNMLDFTVNVRATLEPQDLSFIVHSAMNDAFEPGQGKSSLLYLNTFKPSAPNPTYRFNQCG